MSSFEQRKEPASKEWQYLLFAAEPYVRSTASASLPAAATVWGSAMPAAVEGGCHTEPEGRALCVAAVAGLTYACTPFWRAAAWPVQEVIGFKIPSYEVDKHPEKLFTHWCGHPPASPASQTTLGIEQTGLHCWQWLVAACRLQAAKQRTCMTGAFLVVLQGP